MYVLCSLFLCPVPHCTCIMYVHTCILTHAHMWPHATNGYSLWLALLLQQSPRCVNPSAVVCFSVRPLKGCRVPEPAAYLRLAEASALLFFLPQMSIICPSCSVIASQCFQKKDHSAHCQRHNEYKWVSNTSLCTSKLITIMIIFLLFYLLYMLLSNWDFIHDSKGSNQLYCSYKTLRGASLCYRSEFSIAGSTVSLYPNGRHFVVCIFHLSEFLEVACTPCALSSGL